MTQVIQIDNETVAIATDRWVEVWRGDERGQSPFIYFHGSPGNYTVLCATREQVYERPSTPLIEQFLSDVRLDVPARRTH